MRSCPNCGESLKKNAVSCPNCGTQFSGEADPFGESVFESSGEAFGSEGFAGPSVATKKKKSKVIPIIAIALAALLAIGAALYFSGALKKMLPSSRAKLALAEKELVDSTLDKYFTEVKKVYGNNGKLDIKADMEVSVSLDAKNTGLFSEMGIISALLDQLKLNLGIDFNEERENLGIGLVFKNNPVLDGKLLINKENVGLLIPQLDNKYYTISIDAINKLLSDESEMDVNTILNSFNNVPLDESKFRKEVMDILTIVGKVSTDDNTEIEKDFSYSLFNGEKEIKVEKYTVTPSSEELEKMINEIADYLGRDGCYIAEKIAPLYDNNKDDSDPETAAAFLKENAKYNADQLASKHAHFIACLSDDKVVSQQFISDDDRFCYDTEKTDSAERIYLYVHDNENDLDHAKVDILKDTSDKNKDKGTAKIIIDDDQFDVTYDFDTTKKSAIKTSPGTVSIKRAGSDLAKITISPNGDAMLHEIELLPEAIDLIDMDTSDISGITIKANVTEGAGIEVPSGVEPTDLSGKSVEEITQIFENMISQIGNVIGGVFSPF